MLVRFFRIVAKVALAAGLLAISYMGYGVWQNNRSVPQPDRAELEQSLEKGIRWMAENRDIILDDNNPMLWWMVQESAALTQNPVLQNIFEEYQKRYFSRQQNAWFHLFKAGTGIPIRLLELEHLPDYNIFIIYGVSCNPELAEAEVVKNQLELPFCETGTKMFSPACVTHQMMGFRFMRQRGCGDENDIESKLKILADKVSVQLSWDFRLVDVYLQRVLMLVDTGAINQIKEVWIRRILDAQDSDGGWADFHPLIPLGGQLHMGFTGHGVGVKHRKAGFHTTAQGVLLMSLLLNGQAVH